MSLPLYHLPPSRRPVLSLLTPQPPISRSPPSTPTAPPLRLPSPFPQDPAPLFLARSPLSQDLDFCAHWFPLLTLTSPLPFARAPAPLFLLLHLSSGVWASGARSSDLRPFLPGHCGPPGSLPLGPRRTASPDYCFPLSDCVPALNPSRSPPPPPRRSFPPLSGNFQPRVQTQGLRVVPAPGDSFAVSAAWARKGIEEWIGRQRCPGGSSGPRQLRAAGIVGRGTRVRSPPTPFHPQRWVSIPSTPPTFTPS